MSYGKAWDEGCGHTQIVPSDAPLRLDLIDSEGAVSLNVSVKICLHVPILPSCFENFLICKEVVSILNSYVKKLLAF